MIVGLTEDRATEALRLAGFEEIRTEHLTNDLQKNADTPLVVRVKTKGKSALLTLTPFIMKV